jgi:hypothetical protein
MTEVEDAQKPPAGMPETIEQKYMRETRDALRVIAWVMALTFILGVVAAIIVGVQISKIGTDLGGASSSTSSNCMSQGGTDPSC